MNIRVFRKVLLVLIVDWCAIAILVPTPKAHYLTPLYEAGIDLLMTCHSGQHRTVGILGDSDGSVLRALWSRYSIPVVLIDDTATNHLDEHTPIHQPLEYVVIATDSLKKYQRLSNRLFDSTWWNRYANFIILDTGPDPNVQCLGLRVYMFYTGLREGMLNAQFICLHQAINIFVFTANPFAPYAPKTWALFENLTYKYYPRFYVFVRRYRKGGRNCDDLNFSKTTDLGGYTLYFTSKDTDMNSSINKKFHVTISNSSTPEAMIRAFRYDANIIFVENVAAAFNASVFVTNNRTGLIATIDILPGLFGDPLITPRRRFEPFIFSPATCPFFALTQHTDHKSQLEKILTVIDGKSRICMCVVYIVTFLFFKLFLGQATVPAILNLVRLTCNCGLTRLPKNLSPTIYLACLLAFVVTLQAIYTGNLASLLTQTIAYPHVTTRQDIADPGYTAYVDNSVYNVLAADSNLDGRIIAIPASNRSPEVCVEYLLNDPLATCILDSSMAMLKAIDLRLHISRESILSEYFFQGVSRNNPLGRRLEAIMLLWFENGLYYEDNRIDRLRLQFENDDAVKMNTVRSIMTLDHLGFAFVILIVGLACSSICFISELAIFRARLKLAKRRECARTRLAWEPNETNRFSSLKLRFNVRRLFTKPR